MRTPGGRSSGDTALHCLLCAGTRRAWDVITIPPEFFSAVIYFSVRKECGEFTAGRWPLPLAAGQLFLKGQPRRQMGEPAEGGGSRPGSGAVM